MRILRKRILTNNIVVVRNRNNPSSINHLRNYDYLTITIFINISFLEPQSISQTACSQSRAHKQKTVSARMSFSICRLLNEFKIQAERFMQYPAAGGARLSLDIFS